MGLILDYIVSQARTQIAPALFPRAQIDGLQDRGVAQHGRHSMTEFGSGWRHPSFEEGLIGPGSPPAPEKRPNLTFEWLEQGFVRHTPEDFSSSLPWYLLPDAEKIMARTRPRLFPFLEKHWKAATAVGLLGLYMTKPLSLFSGRDDEANTLEGLRHGGLSQSMRRSMTPFGSGWDPMRALAREAGLSLEKFVAQPHMKLAMASGDVIKELGQGTFGKVHLMESSVRIGEKEHTFQYARKIVIEDSDRLNMFHEVKAQRKLQDLNAPSVYGWSGNQIFMEPFQGRTAWSHMRSGGTLPESFISDLEKFVPEMHSRGVAHMDMTRDMARHLKQEKKIGEIIPHNIILTPEGRAGVIDYGSHTSPGKASESAQYLHEAYNREKFSTNAELDMSLVKSLRANKGKLSTKSLTEINKIGRSTPIVAPPVARTIKAKIRTNTQAIATQKTARNMFTIGRRSSSTFRAGKI